MVSELGLNRRADCFFRIAPQSPRDTEPFNQLLFREWTLIVGHSAIHYQRKGGNMSSETRQLIERVNAKFVEEFNKGDIEAACAAYADDARIMPPGSPTVQGRSAIQDFWSEATKQMGITGIALKTVDFEADGKMAPRHLEQQQSLTWKSPSLMNQESTWQGWCPPASARAHRLTRRRSS